MTILGPVTERTSACYTSALTDETGAAIALTDINALTLTLYDDATGRPINDRDGQNVLNLNGVVVSSTGGITWTMEPADNAIIDRRVGVERHIALFTLTWNATCQLRHAVAIDVTNLERVA